MQKVCASKRLVAVTAWSVLNSAAVSCGPGTYTPPATAIFQAPANSSRSSESSPELPARSPTPPAVPMPSESPQASSKAAPSALRLSLTDLEAVSFAPGDALTAREGDSLWRSRENQAAELVELKSSNSAAANKKEDNPCAALPKVTDPYGPHLVPVLDSICWSFSEKGFKRVLKSADANGSINSFEIVEAPWDRFYGESDKDSAAERPRFLGAGIDYLILATSKHLLQIKFAQAQAQLTRTVLQDIGLNSPPTTGGFVVINQKRSFVLIAQNQISISQSPVQSESNTVGKEQWMTRSLDLGPDNQRLGSFMIVSLPLPKIEGNAEYSDQILATIDGKTYRVELADSQTTPQPSPQAEWSGTSFVLKYCASCHGAMPSGGLKVIADGQKPDLKILGEAVTKMKILERISLPEGAPRRMPPYAPEPSQVEINSFKESLSRL
jgi:hypothetical protein